MMTYVLTILAYLAGSINCSILICKIYGFPDPRAQGSNNPGATNMLRLHGKKYASLVLVGDILKGIIPLIIGHIAGLGYDALGYMSIACVLGHMYPVFFRFNGGKGVATAIGCYLGLNILFGLTCLIIWVAVAFIKKYSSLASLVLVITAPLNVLFFIKNGDIFAPMFLLSFIIVAKHHKNIQRLWSGEESRINL